jgi:RNA recognition motif-containing protein
MRKKIHVGNLSFDSTDDSLRSAFAAYGEVHSASVVSDRDTGRSRGFGFVEMEEAAADEAIRRLDGHELDGRSLRVSEAQSKPRSSVGRRF